MIKIKFVDKLTEDDDKIIDNGETHMLCNLCNYRIKLNERYFEAKAIERRSIYICKDCKDRICGIQSGKSTGNALECDDEIKGACPKKEICAAQSISLDEIKEKLR